MSEQELRVLSVQRAQDGGDPRSATLALRLSRAVDSFEEAALHQQLNVTVHENDKMLAYWPNLNLEEVAQQPGILSGRLANAAGFGARARHEAQQRHDRIDQFVESINQGLQQP
jgi:hypothetical protein